MSLKSELLKFLTRIPNIQTVRQRKALLATIGFEHLDRQINYEGIIPVFCNELIEQLRSEGQVNLVTFLRNLVESGWIGLEDRNDITALADKIRNLTNEEWRREFWGSDNRSSSPDTPFILPQLDISTFTGRKDELKQLEDTLFYQKGEKVCSIVGLTGGGGIGKSALACHFATINKDKFPDGVIGLRVENKDVNTIARELARQIGKPIDPDDDMEAGAIMQQLFAPRRMLLIFDNAEKANIRVLRPGGNRCAVIVTTRNQNLPFSLDVSETATIRLRSLPENDALDLLRKILGQSRIDTALVAAQRIAKVVGRLPLALQVVGAALRGKPRPLESYVDSLQKQKEQLKLLSRLHVRGDTEFNVEASLNLSLELLDEEEIDFFACLSICAEEGFARKTAMAATGFEDEWEAQYCLDKLYELSLLNYAETGQNRFVLHPLVREYAKSLAHERNLRTISEERHANFFVEWLQSENLENKNVVAEVAANLDDVILAAEWLQNNETEAKKPKMKDYKFALKLQSLCERYGYWKKAMILAIKFQSWAEQFEDWNLLIKYQSHEARYWSFTEEFEKAEKILSSAQANLSKIEAIDVRQRRESRLLNVLASVLQKQGKLEEAQKAFERGIAIAKALKDKYHLAIGLNCLGGLFQQQGKLEQAQQAFEQEIVIEESLGNNLSLAIGLNRLGGLFQQQGKLEQAQLAFERGIIIAEGLNDQSSLAIGLNRLGGLLQQQGKLEEAQLVFEREIAITEELNDQSSLAIGLNRLGGLFLQQSKLEEAQQAFERQIAISEEINDQFQLTIGLNCLGGLFLQQGKLEEAQQAFEQQIVIAEEINEQSQLAVALNCLGGLFLQQGKLEEAQQAFERQILIAEEINEQSQLAVALSCLGGLFLQQGKFREAKQKIIKAIQLNRILGNSQSLAKSLDVMSRILDELGEIDQALSLSQECADIEEKLGNSKGLTIALMQVSKFFKKMGQSEKAIETLHKVIEIEEKNKNRKGLVITLQSLVTIQKENNFIQEAIKTLLSIIMIDNELGNQSTLSKAINSVASLSLEMGIDETLVIIREKQEKFLESENDLIFASLLHHIGLAWKRVGEFEQAENVLKSSQEIFEDNHDLHNLAMVLNTLGGALQKQQKWKEAERILRQSYDLALKLEDKKGQAIVANSLGQVKAHQKGDENFESSQMYFRHSIKLGEELNDQQHLAKVHTAMGQSFLAHRDFEKAVAELSQGFDIDESLSNIRGLRIILPNLTYVLIRLGKRDEALKYCYRALEAFPNNSNFLRLRNKIQTAISTGIQEGFIKTGVILYIRYSKKDKLRWGTIVPDDGSPNITFNDKFVDSETKSKLTKGALVEVEVKEKRNKFYAAHIAIIEDEEEYF
ncbi:MAG: tetratricopeptide repeat protein [Cyanobacteria bacterium P01_F01_bin.143]